MSSIFALLFTLLLIRTSSVRVLEDGENPTLRLPLYHARGRHNPNQTANSPPPFSEVLSLDRARVAFLNSRLTKKNSTTANPKSIGSIHSIDPKLVDVPVNPGASFSIESYYIEVGLGTPPTYHRVVVDTGSSFSWVQCEPCQVYCHPQAGPYFNPSASSTYQQLSCESTECSASKEATGNNAGCTSSNVCIYTSTYGDKSISQGYLSQDSLNLGSEQALSNFVFGCGQYNKGIFGQLAGLFGLGRDKLSLFLQLSSKYGSVFSYCLPTNPPLGKPGSGGFLTIGQTSSSSYKFTPMLSDPVFYFLKLSGILVAGRELAVAASEYNVPTIIDSGTTISSLSASVYTALKEELVRIISSKFQVTGPYSNLDACFVGTSDEVSKTVPPVQLIFQGGADVDLLPNNVIVEFEKGKTCLAFVGNSDPREKSIIGNLQQQTIEVVYDLPNSRIGFAAGRCQ